MTSAFESAAREELTGRFAPDTISELKWYCEERRSTSDLRARCQCDGRFWQAHRAFATPRCQMLYRRWLTDGDSVFELISSTAIADALARGTALIESHVLRCSYDHLSPLASLVRSSAKGSRRGTHPPHGLNPLRLTRFQSPMNSPAIGIASSPVANAPAAQAFARCVAAEMGRRFVPPPTAVPVVMGEEPWRERPRPLRDGPVPRAFKGRSPHGSRCPSWCPHSVPASGQFESTKRRADLVHDRREDRGLLMVRTRACLSGRQPFSTSATCPSPGRSWARVNPLAALY
jgi:hypothetical protein